VKVLHIVGDSGFGGAAQSIIRLACMWRARGWQARILATDPAVQRAAEAAGIEVVALNCIHREIQPLRDLVGLFRLWRFLRNDRLTIVHTHTTKAGFVGRIAARLAGVPIVIHTVHGFAFHEQSARAKIAFYALLERIAALCCDRIITVSQFHARWANQLGIASGKRIRAIPNGIPDVLASTSRREAIRAELGISAGQLLLLSPGRLAWEKGLEDLLEAYAQVRVQLAQSNRLVFAGDGPMRGELERLARHFAIQDHVEFLGFRDDVPALLEAADMVILPSQREGLSIALLEAMSAGAPLVVSNIGSNLEATLGNSPGEPVALLVPTRSPDLLAGAILRLARSPELRARLGAGARQVWRQRYTIDRLLQAYFDTYQELLLKKRPRLQAAAPSAEFLKRVFDLAGSLVLLAVLSPVLLLCAAGVACSSRGPILFRQARLGLDESSFQLLKFRTMHEGAREIRNADGSAYCGRSDPRVTGFGRWLRATSLDELPQLLNVLAGDMSLVGPRPDQVDQARFYSGRERTKLTVKPGLTGLAQISGRNSISWDRRKELDVRYAESRSFLLDCKILCKTIPYVLYRKGVNTE